jgi:hypothetical protein
MLVPRPPWLGNGGGARGAELAGVRCFDVMEDERLVHGVPQGAGTKQALHAARSTPRSVQVGLSLDLDLGFGS